MAEVVAFFPSKIVKLFTKKKEEKERLTQIAKAYTSENYGLIMRTNAKGVSEDILKKEIEKLIQEYEKIVLSADAFPEIREYTGKSCYLNILLV